MSTCGVGGRDGGEALWRRSEASIKSWERTGALYAAVPSF